MNKISIKDFIEKCRQDLDEFEEMWCVSNTEDPDSFPENLETGEWLDQFLFFQA